MNRSSVVVVALIAGFVAAAGLILALPDEPCAMQSGGALRDMSVTRIMAPPEVPEAPGDGTSARSAAWSTPAATALVHAAPRTAMAAPEAKARKHVTPAPKPAHKKAKPKRKVISKRPRGSHAPAPKHIVKKSAKRAA
jgi:hypothetical protein